VGRLVIDASALIAFLRGEPGAERVEELLADEASEPFVHALNMAELYRAFLKQADRRDADTAVAELEEVGILIREDLDKELWKRAAGLKAQLRWERRVDGSFADCFCAALAERVKGIAVTTDHGEFEPFGDFGVCSVLFVR
jgi:ribonuclease VapC